MRKLDDVFMSVLRRMANGEVLGYEGPLMSPVVEFETDTVPSYVRQQLEVMGLIKRWPSWSSEGESGVFTITQKGMEVLDEAD